MSQRGKTFAVVFAVAAAGIVLTAAGALWAGGRALDDAALDSLGKQADAMVTAYDGSATGVLGLQAEAKAESDFLFLPDDDRVQRDQILALRAEEGTATIISREVFFVVRQTQDGPLVLARPIEGMPSAASAFRTRVLAVAGAALALAAMLAGLVAAGAARRSGAAPSA